MTKADVEGSVLTICKTFDKITADKVRVMQFMKAEFPQLSNLVIYNDVN